jgi:hypothetical protein
MRVGEQRHATRNSHPFYRRHQRLRHSAADREQFFARQGIDAGTEYGSVGLQ